MGTGLRWTMAGSVVWLLAVGGCGGEPPDSGKEGASSAWSCQKADGTTTCTAVSALAIPERVLYTCRANEGGARCPPRERVELTDWACIGVRLELNCQRQDTSGGGDSNPGIPSTGGDGHTPDGCEVVPWKGYFVDLARERFAAHGMNLVMEPKDLSDEFVAKSPPSGDGSKPSCEPIMTDLEQNAWLAVVEDGCMNLNMEITTWCMNTHSYAAETGICSYSAGW